MHASALNRVGHTYGIECQMLRLPDIYQQTDGAQRSLDSDRRRYRGLTWRSQLQVALHSRCLVSSLTGISSACTVDDAKPEERAKSKADAAFVRRGIIRLQTEASTSSEDV